MSDVKATINDVRRQRGLRTFERTRQVVDTVVQDLYRRGTFQVGARGLVWCEAASERVVPINNKVTAFKRMMLFSYGIEPGDRLVGVIATRLLLEKV